MWNLALKSETHEQIIHRVYKIGGYPHWKTIEQYL